MKRLTSRGLEPHILFTTLGEHLEAQQRPKSSNSLVLDRSLHSMAISVRQPIDLHSLSNYIENTVPEIKIPIIVKQVRTLLCLDFREQRQLLLTSFLKHSLAMGNPIPRISSPPQMAGNLSCERSLQENYSRKQHTKSNASTE